MKCTEYFGEATVADEDKVPAKEQRERCDTKAFAILRMFRFQISRSTAQRAGEGILPCPNRARVSAGSSIGGANEGLVYRKEFLV